MYNVSSSSTCQANRHYYISCVLFVEADGEAESGLLQLAARASQPRVPEIIASHTIMSPMNFPMHYFRRSYSILVRSLESSHATDSDVKTVTSLLHLAMSPGSVEVPRLRWRL